ncbi:MAG: divalent metal cation transporter [Pirellulales bacterium]|nr:divalent metal cation transporter [Pirellulales bacterium]
MAKRGILSRIGPAFIVGACIIGPGSVTLMSRTGANYGYQLIWLSLLSGAMMAGFLAVFMRLGVYSDETFLTLTANRLGRWYAVLCGITLFSVDAAFQFGNALGVKAGMQAIFPAVPAYAWPLLFTATAILFLFGLKRIYGVLEKMMTFFLVFMVAAFLVNLLWALRAEPDLPKTLAAMAQGAFIPSLPKGVNWVVLGGLVGTTLVIVAAFLQPYLVKAKGWTEKDFASGVTDTVLASIMLTLVGTMIMMTAATVLYPGDGQVNFEVMITQLEQVFGAHARLVFSIGFFAAAFSSFITNSVIGGVLLNDGLGLGGRLDSLPTKIFATLVLLIGMGTALGIVYAEANYHRDLTVQAITVGQAVTLLALPLGTIAMVVVLFDANSTRGRALPIWAKAFVLFGATVILGVAAVVFVKLFFSGESRVPDKPAHSVAAEDTLPCGLDSDQGLVIEQVGHSCEGGESWPKIRVGI